MSFGFNGIDKVHFKSNGNVGIGTNSPSDKLTIQSSTGQLRLQGTTNTNKNISIFYNESGDYGQINVDESGVNQKDLWVTGLNLKFGRSTSSESIRIKDDGRLLIGTDTSSVYYNSTSQYAGDVVVDMNIANNVTDLVLINSNNSFGSTVDFATNNSAGNPIRHGLIGAVPDSTTAGSESGHLIFSTKNTTDNNIVERMRIVSSGNVGIGTSSPSAMLHLRSGVSYQPHILLENNVSSAGDAGITFADSVENYAYRLGTDDSGNGLVITHKSGIDPVHGVDNEFFRMTTSGNISIAGNFTPTTATQDLGSTTYPWQNIYTQDMHLSNESRDTGNEIDGTKGNWTIQEGAEDLYIINNKSGKRFRFKLEELD